MTYDKLEKEFEKYAILNDIKSLLHWDTNVNLPKNALLCREKQIKHIEGNINDFLQNKNLQNILKNVGDSNLSEWQKRNLQLMRKLVEENKIYPRKLLEDINTASMRCEFLWREAKQKNKFSIVKDAFKSLFTLIREKASRRGKWLGKNHYEALIDIYSPGLKLETTDKIFDELKSKLPLIISKLSRKNDVSHTSVNLKDKHKFNEIAKKIATDMGFNFNNGRIDTSIHPFCGGSVEDVRMTHGYTGNNFISSLYAVIHETGHGLYAQNLPMGWYYQSVGEACGCAAHEASALLHEFFIGKSKYLLGRINTIISKYMAKYSKAALLSEVKKLQLNNPIRIDADIITYPLHVILRYELEKLLFNDKLQIEDIPDYWKQMHEELLGFKLRSDSEGCLQDIHWYQGSLGYFPSYGIGLIYAAQMYYLLGFNTLQSTKNFKQKSCNLIKRFYEHGSLYEFEDLVKKSTGESLNAAYYYKFINSEYLK